MKPMNSYSKPLSEKEIRRNQRVILPIGYVFWLFFLPEILFPGPPHPRELIHDTVIGRLTAFLSDCLGLGVYPDLHWGLSAMPEIKLLLINPGIYLGLLVGLIGGTITTAFFPPAVATAICILFFFVPGGFWIGLGLFPAILITLPYILFGFLIGHYIGRYRKQ